MQAALTNDTLSNEDEIDNQNTEELSASHRLDLIAAILESKPTDDIPFPSCEGIGARVIFGQHGDESSFEYLSSPDQLWPFVAGVEVHLLKAAQRSHLELMELIGFEKLWIQQKINTGVEFRMILFVLADCSEVIDPTWDGLFSFIRSQSLECANKIAKHYPELADLPFEELVVRGIEVNSLDCEEFNKVCTFEAYETLADDTPRHARAFLRHTLKCTSLFAGDGYTHNEQNERGIKEYMVKRNAIADIHRHRWIPMAPPQITLDN